MTTSNGDLSHGTLLSESLQRLNLESTTNDSALNDPNDEIPSPPHKLSRSVSSVVHEGYGFRPRSGASTPAGISIPRSIDSPLPDRHGLGWPGTFGLNRITE